MKNFVQVLGVGAVLGLLSAPASAGFLGDTVSADYQWPDLGNVFYASGNAVASAGVEFDDIGGFGVGTSPSVDFSDTNILVDYAGGWFISGVGTFDGWVFTDLSANIAGVSLAGTNMSGFTSADLSFDSNHVYANTLGLGPNFDQGTFISIDVSFAPAPEPATLAVLGLGLAGLGIVRRKRAA